MQFYGQFDPPVDRFIYERYFRGRPTPGLCIECGAFDGLTESSCKFFEESLGWSAINVEPFPHAFRDLVRNRPRSRNLRAALSDHQGTAEFTAAIHPALGYRFGNGSLSHLPAHRKELDRIGCTYESYPVETLTYADLLKRFEVRQVDLFVLDVEGHEPSVLKGMADLPLEQLPRVFCVEFGNIGLEAARAAVEPLGFVFDATSHINAFFLREDFSEMAGALFRTGYPGLAWNAAELESTLRHLWREHLELQEAYRRLQDERSR